MSIHGRDDIGSMKTVILKQLLFILSFELGLGFLGWMGCFLAGIPILNHLHFDAGSLLLGVVAGILPGILLLLSDRIALAPLADLKRLVEREVWPMLRRQSLAGLVLISLSAGVGEELLFRGLLQDGLARFLGVPASLVLASLVFGLFHPVHWLYIVIAGAIGFYLGGLYIATENLVVPILAHAVYDAIALGYYKLFDPAKSIKASHSPRSADMIEEHENWIHRGEFVMKAAFVREPGPASTIVVEELPAPTLKGKEVLVGIRSAAVNPIDTYVRAGLVKMPIPLPYIIGSDVAGVVEQVGPDAKRFKVGDRVWGSNQGLLGRQGITAEFAAIDEDWLYSTPANASDDTMAALALVGITAHLGLFRDAKLHAGETIFVSGGAGGVGSTVVQMAKAVGARVITTVGSDANAANARSFGADEVLNYKTADLARELPQLAPNGIDVWWETIREPNLELAIPLLAKRGRLVLMAGRDAKPAFPVGAFYTKDCKVVGFAMFNATPDEQRVCAEDINRWVNEGKLKANIGRVFALTDAAQAHTLQEENTLHKKGTLSGKIIIKP